MKELLDVTGQGTTPMSKLTIATAQFALDRLEGTQWLEASFAAGGARMNGFEESHVALFIDDGFNSLDHACSYS